MPHGDHQLDVAAQVPPEAKATMEALRQEVPAAFERRLEMRAMVTVVDAVIVRAS